MRSVGMESCQWGWNEVSGDGMGSVGMEWGEMKEDARTELLILSYLKYYIIITISGPVGFLSNVVEPYQFATWSN